MAIPFKRKFNGKMYHEKGSVHTKAEALKLKTYATGGGCVARIVQNPKGEKYKYSVYRRCT
jgi:hypothetical protein